MNQNYWVSIWAKRRQDEVIAVPKSYHVHKDFLFCMTKDEVKAAFSQINTLFKKIYSDIAKQPEAFGMPLHFQHEHRVFSSEWRDSGQAPYRPFILLYNLLICSEVSDNELVVSIEKFKAIKPPPKYLSGIDQKIKRQNFLFNKLTDHGFVFEGLKNNKPANSDITIAYPDNPALLQLLKLLADKASGTRIVHNARSIKPNEDPQQRSVNRLCDFLCCHFRLLQDDMTTANYGVGIDDIADRVHSEVEKEFCYQMDELLLSKGFVSELYGGVECHGIAYYHSEKDRDSKKPYSFRMITRDMDFEQIDDEIEKMRLQLRIRNVNRCREYLNSCSDSVKRIFTEYSDEGCGKRIDGICKHGISYEIDHQAYWRCACCHTPFNFKPVIKDIPHYLKLVEMGEKA